MGFFDDIFNEDIIWVVLLLLLVFILPQICSRPILDKGPVKEESPKCEKDIICRNAKGQRERRRLVY